MSTVLESLSNLYPFWTRNLVPTAIESLRRGIERERARFRGKPFVVAGTRQEFDYDGLTEHFELLQGFALEDEAIAHARSCAESARQEILAMPSSVAYPWRVAEERYSTHAADRRDREPVSLVYHQQIKLETGSGYDLKYLDFVVLHVRSEDVIGPDLLEFVGREHQVTRYLIDRGAASSPERDTSVRSE